MGTSNLIAIAMIKNVLLSSILPEIDLVEEANWRNLNRHHCGFYLKVIILKIFELVDLTFLVTGGSTKNMNNAFNNLNSSQN